MVHKLYIDSRSRISGNHAEFVWQADNNILVDKCRAFIDSCNIPNTFGTITNTNKYVFIAEELVDFTVLSNQNKIYLREIISGITSERIIQLSAAVYTSEANLATELQTKLGGNYIVTSTTGQLNISNSSGSFKIFSRKELQTLKIFANTNLISHALDGACDLLGLTIQSSSGNLYLGKSLLYRKCEIAIGNYTFHELTAALQLALNGTGKTLLNYVVNPIDLTGKINITNPSTLKFYLYTEHFLRNNPYDFPGEVAPFYGSDYIIGFESHQPLQGNNITGENHVNVSAYHSLFIHCDLGTHSDSIGPMGQTTIARKININVPYGNMIHDFHSSSLDYISLEQQTVSAIRFRLTDWMGNTITMSCPWSMSIILIPEIEF